MQCPECSIDQPPDHRFCEDCGARLEVRPIVAVPVPKGAEGTCAECGAGDAAVDGDGFCSHCGFQRIAPARDHVEVVVSRRLAGVSDRGKRYPRNEDALALESAEEGDVLIVCDGVSSSQRPDEASTVAAAAASEVLVATLQSAAIDLETAVGAAILAAEVAVRAVPYARGGEKDPPATTIVAALHRGRRVAIGWLGDSRAYFIGSGGSRQLTRDHSWVHAVVDAGEMTLAEALEAPEAHYVTRTLGGHPDEDSPRDDPSLATFDLSVGPGLLVLCSDGLWGYARDAEQIAAVIAEQPAGADALMVARGLVNFARDRGGHDNITAVVLRV